MDHPWQQHKPNSSPFNYHHDHAFLSHPPNPPFDTHLPQPPPEKMEKKLDKIIHTNGDDHTHLAELLNALPMEESLKEEEEEEEEEEFVSNIKNGHSGIDGGGVHNDNDNDNVSVIINANVRSKRKKRLSSVDSSTGTNTWTKAHINTTTHSSVVGNTLVCQIEGCMNGDLRKAKKDYHRRHKVCEMHSKAPLVIKGGVAQRFCQQCSRFHVLSEFDDAKRSCRRRLEGHNRRRRKPTYSPTFIASAASLLQLGYHDKIQQLLIQHHGHQISTPTRATNLQQLQGLGNATPLTMVASNPLHYVSDIGNKVYTIVNHDGLSSSPSLLHLQHDHHAPMPTYGANIDNIIQGKGAFPNASGDVCAPSCALSLLSSHPLHLSTNHQYITSTNEGSVTTLQDVIKIPNLNHITYHQDNHINSIHNVGGLLDPNNGPTLTMSSMSHMRKDKPFFMATTNEGHYDSEMVRLGYSWS